MATSYTRWESQCITILSKIENKAQVPQVYRSSSSKKIDILQTWLKSIDFSEVNVDEVSDETRLYSRGGYPNSSTFYNGVSIDIIPYPALDTILIILENAANKGTKPGVT